MKEREFKFEKLAVSGLTWSTGALVVAGILSLLSRPLGGEPALWPEASPTLTVICVVAFAGMGGFSLLVSQAAAGCAQLLKGDKLRAERLTAWFCAGVTALTSVAGVYLADSVLGGHPIQLPPLPAMLVGAGLLGFIKPAMRFVLEACGGVDRDAVRGADVVLAAKDQRIADLERQVAQLEREAKKPLQDKAPAPSRVSASQARKLARELSGQQPNGASRRSDPPPCETVTTEVRDVSIEEVEAACRAIMERRDDDGAPVTPSLRLDRKSVV